MSRPALRLEASVRASAHMHAYAVLDDADFSDAADPSGQLRYFDAILCAPRTRNKNARTPDTLT